MISIVDSIDTLVNKLSTSNDANNPFALVVLRIKVKSSVDLIEYADEINGIDGICRRNNTI